VDLKPSKLVAGAEPFKTNKMLQLLAQAATASTPQSSRTAIKEALILFQQGSSSGGGSGGGGGHKGDTNSSKLLSSKKSSSIKKESFEEGKREEEEEPSRGRKPTFENNFLNGDPLVRQSNTTSTTSVNKKGFNLNNDKDEDDMNSFPSLKNGFSNNLNLNNSAHRYSD